MAQANPNFRKIKRQYIFSIIEKKLEELKDRSEVINLGIGDVALPLAPTVARAIGEAAIEMSRQTRGYGPSCGYPFLREAICANEYASLGIVPDELFVSDGTNSDTVNILDLFHPKATIGIVDPTYPVYLDASLMSGRKVTLLPALESNGFFPKVPSQRFDLIYLCTPNNPTGIALTRKELGAWVSYAHTHQAILLIDNAYGAFIRSPDVPRSIYEIPGALEVAIEFRSFSKSAGFTGVRCAYAVIPKKIKVQMGRKTVSIHALWDQRQSTKTNGVSYPVQKGALASLCPQGKLETGAQVASYLAQADRLKEGLLKRGFTVYGGSDCPYLWWKVPTSESSWSFFDTLLEKCRLISIPGVGFGESGEGYVRLSAFTQEPIVTSALQRIDQL